MGRYDYDLFVIGGGSGGVRAARLAGALGKRVAIAEESRFGGTCVIRGCVPKKLFVYASQYSGHFRDSCAYGWSHGPVSFDWPTLKSAKDREIARLEGLYRANVERAGVETFATRAEIAGPNRIRLIGADRDVTAETILIATGAAPNRHPALPGHALCLTSDEVFEMDTLPRSVIVAGGGYIAVEFANIFHGLGVETRLIYRGREILSRFDLDLRHGLHAAMEAKGIEIILHDVFEEVARSGDGLAARTASGRALHADAIVLALGRRPNTTGLGLDTLGIDLGPTGEIPVDAFSRTAAPGVWAIGDVTDRVQLTPVAIHEAICLIDTLYRDAPRRPDYEAIATAVFSQPEIGTVGLSEAEAQDALGDVDVYATAFRPLHATITGGAERMLVKLVVDAASDVVVGAHVLGHDAGELAQVLAIAVRAKLTKAQFDATMAVHPTAAEELVTMYTPSRRHRVETPKAARQAP